MVREVRGVIPSLRSKKPVDPMSNRQLAASKRLQAQIKGAAKAKGSGKGPGSAPGAAAKAAMAKAKAKAAPKESGGTKPSKKPAAKKAVRGDSVYGVAKKAHRLAWGDGWTEMDWRQSPECYAVVVGMPTSELYKRKLDYLLDYIKTPEAPAEPWKV